MMEDPWVARREALARARQGLMRRVTWGAGQSGPAPASSGKPVEPVAASRDPDWEPFRGLGFCGEATLLERIASEENLLDAWHDVLEADRRDGRVSIGVQRFGSAPLENLTNLRDTLLAMDWRPGGTTAFDVGSPGKPRVIKVSDAPDRVVERAIASVLAPVLDDGLTAFCFGFRRGLGVKDAVECLREAGASGWSHVLRADVRHAFDEVPRPAALAELDLRVGDRRVIELVERLLARLDGGLGTTGIPQGSSISPLLLNLYLDRLDRRILALGRMPIRYADDLAIPVAGEEDGLNLLDEVVAALADLGLHVSDSKTDLVSFSDGVEYLGQVVRDPAQTRPPDTSHPQRISVFVPHEGAVCRLRSGRLRVDRGGETIGAISLSRVQQVVVSGRVGLTTPLIAEAARTGVDIVLLTDTGGYLGRLSRRRGGDVSVRQAQFRAADDPEVSLALARRLVVDKIANQRVAVQRQLRQTKATEESGTHLNRTVDALEGSAAHAASAISHAGLMGLEGSAARTYFQWIADSVSAEWSFTGRNRRPPRDPINAMLSFGYTLLAAEMISACERAHLDPDLGFLHSPRWGRPSLALDLMEQWRPVIVDAIVLSLVRREAVTSQEFTTNPETGCRMSPTTKKTLLKAYEHRMLGRVPCSLAGGRRPMRDQIALHAGSLAKALRSGDPLQYEGYRWR